MTRETTIRMPAQAGADRLEADLLRTALECVDVVWVSDRDRRIAYISAGITELTGYPPEAHIGRRWYELPWIRLAPGAIGAADAAYAARAAYRDRRMTVFHRDGRRRAIAVSGRPAFDAAGGFAGYRGIAVEVSEAVRAETILQQIGSSVGNRVGEAYLQTLVRAVAEALGASTTFVGRVVGPRRDRIHTIAAYADGSPIANYEYAVAGTPCERVVAGETCLHPSGVAAQFPDDRALADDGVEAYCGLPLLDAEGRPIGLLVVQSRTRFNDPDLVYAAVQVFAERAALELERQAAEALLRQNRDLLIASQRLGKLGYIVTDIAHDRVTWSDTLFELRRVTPRDSFTHDESMELIHPDDRPHLIEARAAALAGRRTFESDIRVLCGDGTVGWNHLTARPQFDEHGNHTGFLVLVQDITESRLAREALKRQEDDLKTIMDNAPLMIFMKDRDGRYRLCNRAYCEFLRSSATDLYGRTVADMVPPSVTAELQDHDRAVLERGEIVTSEFESRRLGHVGGPEHVLFTKFPIRDDLGTITGIAGFGYDIGKRKRAEDAVRRSEERFRALIEHSNDMVTIVRPDGTFTYRSPSVQRQLGFGTEEIVGSSVFDRVHPDDGPAFREEFLRVAASPGSVATGRCRVRHKNGSWRHVAWSARNATDIPAVVGIIINSRDITDALELEAQLRQAQKMEAVGQLAGGIAHDFNNIVGAILGFAGFLTEDLPAGSPELGYAERIVGAGSKAKDLVQHILAFSRGNNVQRRPEDIAGLVRNAEGLLRAGLPSSTELELEVARDALIADVNSSQIDQVLLNLCVNANDALAGEPGKVSITVTRVTPGDRDYAVSPGGADGASRDAPDRINRVATGTLDGQKSYARIAVSDSGVGMPPEVIGRIFDPFFTTKERGRGTGLGLSILHGVVVGYGGACRVESAPGRGTTFLVYIPLDAAPLSPAGAVPDRSNVRGHETVLVVDDEADIVDVLAIGLGRFGYRVTSIGDSAAALTAFERDPAAWDVVISDQVMPGMKGMALFKRLKAIKPDLRFILWTGFSDAASETQALAAGVDAFLIKPASPEEVAASIRRIVTARDVVYDATGEAG
jgi:PAS domain S-box-containing protein